MSVTNKNLVLAVEEEAVNRYLRRDRRRSAHYLESFRDTLRHIGQFSLADEAEEIRERILDGSDPSPFYQDPLDNERESLADTINDNDLRFERGYEGDI